MKHSCHENCRNHGRNVVERMYGRFCNKAERKMAGKEDKLTGIEKACHGAKIIQREIDFHPMNG